jgi:hypothetical protein
MVTPFILWSLFILSLIACAIAGGYTARCGWRLMLSTRAASLQLLPLVEGLSARGERAATRAEELAVRAEEFDENLTDLLASIERVAILARTLQEAQGRWSRVTSFIR